MTANGIVDDGGRGDGGGRGSEPSFVDGNVCCFFGR